MLTLEKANELLPVIRGILIVVIMVIGFAIGWIAENGEDDENDRK